MPGCMPPSDHEQVAAEAKSFTGQYLKPLLERSSTAQLEPAKAGGTPDPIRGPKKSTRSSRAKSRDADADQPDLIPAK